MVGDDDGDVLADGFVGDGGGEVDGEECGVLKRRVLRGAVLVSSGAGPG